MEGTFVSPAGNRESLAARSAAVAAHSRRADAVLVATSLRCVADPADINCNMCGKLVCEYLKEEELTLSDRAPGLLRSAWGFNGWLRHDPALWRELLAEARQRAEAGHVEIAS